MPREGNSLRTEEQRRYRRSPRLPRSAHSRHYYSSRPTYVAVEIRRKRRITRCQSAPKIMDTHSRSASPRDAPRPQHRPPSPPSDSNDSNGTAFANHAYQHDEDSNHNESFVSSSPTQNGHSKEPNGDTKALEAVNLELINMAPKNGNAKKKDIEVDMSPTSPYDEYFVPVNEHRKYMRGEKLYVTADKRSSEKAGCKRPLCWTLVALGAAVAIAIIILAATGVLFSSTLTPVEPYNASVSSARAFGGITLNSSEDKKHSENDIGVDIYNEDHNNQDRSLQTTQEDITAGKEEHKTERMPVFRADVQNEQPDSSDSDDSKLYIPRTMEGELMIDNEEFSPSFEDPENEEYKEFTKNFSEGLKKALFDRDTLDNGEHEITVEVVNLRKGSIIVTYRINWKPKYQHQNAADDQYLTSNAVDTRLNKYLERNNRMIDIYHIAETKMTPRPVLDLCQNNKNGCEYKCEFDTVSLGFTCVCPNGLIVDPRNLKSCIPFLTTPDQRLNINEMEVNVPSTTTTTSKSMYDENIKTIDKVIKENQLNDSLPTTSTEFDSELEFHHIINLENEHMSSVPAAEPKPEPTAEPETNNSKETSELEPRAEPTPDSTTVPVDKFVPLFEVSSVESKPEPEPTTELGTEPVPAAEPKSEPEPTAEPKPEPTTETKPEPEPTAEPKSEPEPTAAPKSLPVPTAKPTTEPEPTFEPKPEPTAEPAPETTADPTGKPTDEPTRKRTHEPIAEATPEPTAEPTREPTNELIAKTEAAPELFPVPNSEPELTADPKQEPELTTEPESELAHEMTSKPEDSKKELVILSDLFRNMESQTTTETNLEDTTATTTIYNISEKSLEKSSSISEEHIPELASISPESIEDDDLVNMLNKLESQTQMTFEDSEHTTVTASPEIERVSLSNIKIVNDTTDEATPDLIAMLTQSLKNTSDNAQTEADFSSLNVSHTLDSERPRSFSLDDQQDVNTTTITPKVHSMIELVLQKQAKQENADIENESHHNHSFHIERQFDTEKNFSENEGTLTTTASTLLEEINQSISRHQNRSDSILHDLTTESNGVDTPKLQVEVKTTVIPERQNQYFLANQYQIVDNGVDLVNALHEKKTTHESSETTTEENITDESRELTFDVINNLNNRSSKAIVKENVTHHEIVTEVQDEKHPTTTESDWLDVDVKETNLNMNTEEETGSTEMSLSKIDDLINRGIQNDFEPEYLTGDTVPKKFDHDEPPLYGMANDYENEDTRVKRLKKKANDTTEAISTERVSDKTTIASTPDLAMDLKDSVDLTSTPSISTSDDSLNTKTNIISLTTLNLAPVWEESEGDKDITNKELTNSSPGNKNLVENSDSSRNISLQNSTQENDFNVTIYEVSKNISLSSQKSSIQSTEYEDHETEMNPFLPEVENNKSLVKKLQEGHDLEPVNLNETQNEFMEDHAIHAHYNNSRSSSEEAFRINMLKNESYDTLGTENHSTKPNKFNEETKSELFLMDTDDLDVSKDETTETKFETTTLDSKNVSGINDNSDYLSVVPIMDKVSVEKLNKIYKSEKAHNLEESDLLKKSDKRTKIDSVLSNEA